MDPSTNPYQSPGEDAQTDDATAKAAAQVARLGVLYRRGTAFMIELSVVNSVLLPLSWVVLGDELTLGLGDLPMIGRLVFDPASLIPLLAYFALRDIGPRGSPLKAALGLRLESQDGGSLGLGARIARNLVLAIPLFPLIEWFVARNDPQCRRTGDRMVRSRVVDDGTRPQAIGRWLLYFGAALAGLMIANKFVAGAVFRLLGGDAP